MLPAKADKVYGKHCRYYVAFDNHTSQVSTHACRVHAGFIRVGPPEHQPPARRVAGGGYADSCTLVRRKERRFLAAPGPSDWSAGHAEL